MATGDLRGNLERLRMQLLSVNYPHPFDVQGLKQGIPAVVLPLLHYALLGYSRHVARYLSASGYELYAKSDLRFMESALKFFRQEFNYRCALTIAQMFSRGYAERKMIFIYDIIQMCKRKHNELLKLGRDKTNDKAELTQINYDSMSGCGHGISNVKNPRACEVSATEQSPSFESKPWEHTLRSSKNPVRCSKDAGCVQLDIPVLPVSQPTSPRRRNLENDAEHHQNGSFSDKGSNIKSMEAPSGTHARHFRAKVKKYVTYQQDLADVQPSALSDLPEGDSGHQEICQRIMDMADKLEARFSTLEAGVTRARETLQEKLVSLEGRVQNLESILPSKQEQKLVNLRNSRELPRRNSKGHVAAYTTGDLSDRKNLAFASTCTSREPPEDDTNEHVSTCTSVEILKPKCNEHAWSFSPKVDDGHCEEFTGVAASKSLKSQAIQRTGKSPAIRDISNTHQCVVKNLTNPFVGSSQVKSCDKGYTLINQPVTSTRDFIAGVRARFNRTLEVLLRNTFRLRRSKRLKRSRSVFL